MDKNEVNKIIGEFMGWTRNEEGTGWYTDGKDFIAPWWTESLDALVSVWEKLELSQIRIGDSFGLEQTLIFKGVESSIWSEGETIQEAAAKATALAILELEKKGE